MFEVVFANGTKSLCPNWDCVESFLDGVLADSLEFGEWFDDMLNWTYGDAELIGNVKMSRAELVKRADPVLYRTARQEEADNVIELARWELEEEADTVDVHGAIIRRR